MPSPTPPNPDEDWPDDRSYAFFTLPATSRSEATGVIRGVGLARLHRPVGTGQGHTPEPLRGCRLAQVPHAHVYSAELDLNLVRGDGLLWDLELGALAESPDAGTVDALQRRLAALKAPAEPQVSSGVVRSHGLVWTDGSPVPVGTSFERCHAILPVIGLIGRNAETARAFGDCLRNPHEGLARFLGACLVAAQLEEQLRLVEDAEADEASALRALFGETVGAEAPAIVALAAH